MPLITWNRTLAGAILIKKHSRADLKVNLEMIPKLPEETLFEDLFFKKEILSKQWPMMISSVAREHEYVVFP